jgi:hypothetical protein
MATWRSGGGLDHMNSMVGDLNRMANAGKNADPVAMNQACLAEQNDVEAAQAYAPIPDGIAQQHWAEALTQLARATADCRAATSTMNADLMNQSAAEIKAGNTEMVALTTRLGELQH